jgi:hypothetical protein
MMVFLIQNLHFSLMKLCSISLGVSAHRTMSSIDPRQPFKAPLHDQKTGVCAITDTQTAGPIILLKHYCLRAEEDTLSIYCNSVSFKQCIYLQKCTYVFLTHSILTETLRQVFVQVLQSSPVSIIPPWLSILIYHMGG